MRRPRVATTEGKSLCRPYVSTDAFPVAKTRTVTLINTPGLFSLDFGGAQPATRLRLRQTSMVVCLVVSQTWDHVPSIVKQRNYEMVQISTPPLQPRVRLVEIPNISELYFFLWVCLFTPYRFLCIPEVDTLTAVILRYKRDTPEQTSHPLHPSHPFHHLHRPESTPFAYIICIFVAFVCAAENKPTCLPCDPKVTT